MKMYQITLDGKATQFIFENRINLIDKMIELVEKFPKSIISFLIVRI